jgi:hypothetical protein
MPMDPGQDRTVSTGAWKRSPYRLGHRVRALGLCRRTGFSNQLDRLINSLKEGGPGRDPLPELHALLVCGDTAGAVVSVEKTQARTDVGLEYASWARATIALAQHNPQQTIVELDPLRRRDSTTIGPGLRGMAYMELKKPAEAVTEFRKLVERRSQLFDPWYPWARLQLARSLAQAGNTAEAKKSYEAFLTLWKDADPGIPLMDQAKKEYAALR